jgi:hypothetical protein
MLTSNWYTTSGGVMHVATKKKVKYQTFLSFLTIKKLVLNKFKKIKKKTIN